MSGEQIKPGYKRTEVGVIPEGWSASVFRAVVEAYIDFRGRTPRKLGMDWGGGDILALSANNVQMGEINTEKEAYFGSNDLYKKWMTQGDCEKGDVLITMEAPLGNIAQVPDEKKYILSQRVLLIKPKSILTRDFLAHYMRGSDFQGQLVANSSGSTALGIQRARLDEITIATPPLSEQRAIGTALSDVDALLAKLDQLIAKKRDLKQAAMQQLLTGQTRLPGFSGEWEVNSFSDVFYRINGKAYQIQSSHYKNSGDYPVVDQGQQPVVGFSDQAERVFRCPSGGVIVFGDHTCIVKFVNFDFVVGADGTQIIAVKSDQSARFHAYQLVYSEIPTTGYNRHFKFVRERKFLAPTFAEQTAIATVLSEMDTELAALEARRIKTFALKQGMMQELLTGRIRLV